MATNLTSVAITWSRAIMSGAQYRSGMSLGQPGFYVRPDLVPGAAELLEGRGGQPILVYVCPCGCGTLNSLPLAPMPGQQGWSWEIAEDMRVAPTLSPSISRKYGCRWHGDLKAGVWIPRPDWMAAQPKSSEPIQG